MTNIPLRITRTPLFKRHYQECIAKDVKLKEIVVSALRAFAEDRTTPDLRDHQLTGSMKKLRAFSVSEDVRIIYQNTANGIILLDIGRHKSVYRG